MNKEQFEAIQRQARRDGELSPRNDAIVTDWMNEQWLEADRARIASLKEKRRQAAALRRYVREHDWHMNQDDIDLTLEMAGDLEKETKDE